MTAPGAVVAMVSTGAPVGVGLVSACVLGPVTVWLIRANRREPWTGRLLEAVAVSATVGLFAAIALQHPRGYGLLPLMTFGVAAAAVDVTEQRLPDPLTGCLAGATAAVVLVECLFTGCVDSAIHAAVIAAAVGVGALAGKVIRTAMLGWGDVKFLLGLGTTLGWWSIHAIFFALVFWGALILAATAIVGLERGNPQPVVPYGPALLLGTLGALAVVA